MLTSTNRLTQARDDILISEASSDSLELLSLLYGVPWLRELSESAQRKLLRTVVYSVRGTYTAFFSAIRAFYYDREIVKSNAVLVGGDLSTLPRITHADITSGYSERLVEFVTSTYSNIYYITHATAGQAYLCPVKSSQTTQPPALNTLTTGTLRVLAFTMHERQPSANFPMSTNLKKPCEVIIEVDSEVYEIPSTYLRENGNARTNDPFGGHLLSLFDNDPTTPSNGNQTTGAYPLYFAGDGVNNATRSLFDHLLASGIKLTMKAKKYDNSPFLGV